MASVGGFMSRQLNATAVALPVVPVGPYPMSSRLAFLGQYREEKYWCWAATATAIGDFYGKTYTQCAVATAVLAAVSHLNISDCCANRTQCDREHDFEPALQHIGNHARTTLATASFADIHTAVTVDRRPIALRWKWNAGGGHVSAIYGIGQDARSRNFISLADPDRMHHPTDILYSGVGSYGPGLTWTHTYWTQP